MKSAVIILALSQMPTYWQEIFEQVEAEIDSPYYTSVDGRYAWDYRTGRQIHADGRRAGRRSVLR